MSSKIWPMEVTMKGEEIVFNSSPYLTYGHKEAKTIQYCEKRPVWIVEQRMKDPNYIYRKQILYIDKEYFACLIKFMWDQDENLWKITWCDHRWWPSGHTAYWFGEFIDLISMHRTHLKMDTEANPPVSDDFFNTRFLNRIAR